MALLTVAQLQKDMGRDSRPFTSDEADTAQFIIDRIETYILSRCSGLAFTVTEITEKMQADYDGIIDLKYYPVTEVSSVKNHRSGVETVWDWDDFSEIFGLCPFETVDVTLKYGFTDTPDDLVNVARSMAFREMSNPQGVRQQTVGAISETYGNIDISDYEDRILSSYEVDEHSYRLGFGNGKSFKTLPTL